MRFLTTILLMLSTTVIVSAGKHDKPKPPCDHCNIEGEVRCGTTGEGQTTAVKCANHCWTLA
jgi:hypothetical protein